MYVRIYSNIQHEKKVKKLLDIETFSMYITSVKLIFEITIWRYDFNRIIHGNMNKGVNPRIAPPKTCFRPIHKSYKLR